MRSVKAILLAVLLFSGLLTGCRSAAPSQRADYYDLFDTYSYLIVYDISEEDFQQLSSDLHEYLLRFHRLTDIYTSYDGEPVNLRDLNEQAGGEPMALDPQLIDFLIWCREAWDITGGRVNVAIGPVTALWHEARTIALEDPEKAFLPSDEALQEASRHTDIHKLVLDEEAGTACLTDPDASLDVGALAKGYAGRLAVTFLQERGIENFLLCLGGNVCAFGQPQGTGRDYFIVGIEDPTGEGAARTCQVKNSCVVTSGDYQRYFELNGVRYHHIVDPDTLYPASLHHSVTVIHPDSALADLLSTALFLMTAEEGEALAARYGAQVIY